LKKEHGIAVALIDIVMETDDAGLRLINFIRNELRYRLIRLIVRTGQTGMAPEKQVIEEYDIDDYKSKTELRADKLYLTMRVTLKAYRDLMSLDANRLALHKILEAVPKFHHAQSLTQFFNGVLTQLINLCNLGQNSLIYSINDGLVITTDPSDHQTIVQSGTGRFSPDKVSEDKDINEIRKVCLDNIVSETPCQVLPKNALLIPLKVQQKNIGFVYLENASYLSPADLDLIQIMAQQCSSALENLQLYIDLKEANRRTLKMLEIAEQARQEAESANQAKSQFLANMSHELRTPLNAILGYTEMLEDTVTELEQDDYLVDLNKIKKSGYHLLDMINEVLDFSKLDNSEILTSLVEFELQHLLDNIIETVKPLIEETYNEFKYQPIDFLGKIESDKAKLHQILLTLLTNAAKFTEKGTVELRVERLREQVIFKVIDNGIGMTEKQKQEIFLPFTQADNSSTRRYDGCGLGLTVSHRLAKVLGGKLEVETRLNEGSTFILSLPIFAPK